MPSDYHHGVRVIEINNGTRTIRTIATAVVGIVATAPDADANQFPLNRPVLISNLATAITAAGHAGTLAATLQAIHDQTDPLTVVVRVAAGANENETTTNVIGGFDNGHYTGLQALLAAEAQLGVKPRILAAPGLDTHPVTSSLATIAAKLRAMAYASCATAANKEDAVAYRKEFSARELLLIWPDFLAWDTVANATAPAYATARAIGLRAKIDETVGWHKTLSNVPVEGVTGIARDVHFDLQQPGTDAGFLNAADVTTLVRANGYRFWGNRTCSSDPLFAFESSTRTAQILADTIAESLLWAVDQPLHPSLVRDILEGINAKFRELKNAGSIIDAKAWYDSTTNTNDTLAAGKLIIDYDFTPVPPAENITLNQRITSRYLADFATRITG